MKIIAFIQERHEIIKILKHIGIYPTEIPVIESRASPHEYLRASAPV